MVSLGFFVSMFLSPIFGSIPPYATGPALVLVGASWIPLTCPVQVPARPAVLRSFQCQPPLMPFKSGPQTSPSQVGALMAERIRFIQWQVGRRRLG